MLKRMQMLRTADNTSLQGENTHRHAMRKNNKNVTPAKVAHANRIMKLAGPSLQGSQYSLGHPRDHTSP